MALVSQAEHARLCGVSRKSVTMWKAAGKLTMVGDLVDHEASYKGENWHAGVKKSRQAPQVGRATAGAAGAARIGRSSADRQGQPKAAGQPAAGDGGQDAPEVAPAGAAALKEAVTRKEEFAGRLRELEFRKKAGELIERSAAEQAMFDEARAVRDAWMNWPARVSALIAADLGVEADVVASVLQTYVHQQLEQLGTPERAFEQG